jgi:hypothetical protein
MVGRVPTFGLAGNPGVAPPWQQGYNTNAYPTDGAICPSFRQHVRWKIASLPEREIMHPLRIVYESLRDCVIGFALIVAGFAFAVWLWGGSTTFWFTVCLCTGMLPFAWFAKKRGSAKFSWWDYLAWAAFVLMVSTVSESFKETWGQWASVTFLAVSFGCFGWMYQTIRKRLAPKSAEQGSRS